MKKIGVISLGCDKNRVDTEYMLATLKRGGYELVSDEREADIMIINTCAFLESARAESIDAVLETAQLKEGKLQKLIVTGCLPQKYKEELKPDLSEVDAFLGVKDYGSICEIIQSLYENEQKPQSEKDYIPFERVLTTVSHAAYLRIADGCSNACTYCLIPSIRGKYVSRPTEEIILEAKNLVGGGVQELILVAQDVSNYGKDLYGKISLVPLLQELSKIEDLLWIRLLYCYPERVDDSLIAEIRDNEKIAKYIDIPFQHASDSVLRAMGRGTSREKMEALVRKLRQQIPSISIRSTFIVGFPTETEEDFHSLCQFLTDFNLENAGFFPYSQEEGTRAAKLPNQIPNKTKLLRLKAVQKLQTSLMREKQKTYKGKTLKVLCDGIDYDKECFFGRHEGQCLDVDTQVCFYGGGTLIESGKIYDVKITKTGLDLTGKVNIID